MIYEQRYKNNVGKTIIMEQKDTQSWADLTAAAGRYQTDHPECCVFLMGASR